MSFAVAQVTPHAWDVEGSELNTWVARVGGELAARGHRVVVLAPARSHDLVRATRAALREDVHGLLPAPGEPPRVLAVGEVLPTPTGARRVAALPIDVARTVEDALTRLPLDICHVHEPFAPSVASAALRHSRALNVGTFHLPSERGLSTQVARKLVRLVLGRLDARTASYQATANLMARYFPGDYAVLPPGTDAPLPRVVREPGAPVRIAFLDEEERPALRLFLRALRGVQATEPWEVVVRTVRGPAGGGVLRADLHERVRFVAPAESSEAKLLADVDVICWASDGALPAPHTLLHGLVAGAVPVASCVPVYEELLDEGTAGLTFPLRDDATLAAQLSRLIDDATLRERLRAGAAPTREQAAWQRVADDCEVLYEELGAQRHTHAGDELVQRRLAGRPLLDSDLHMHTDHSHDCATPVEVLLAAARDEGLGAIAVTDHNEISGALEAAEKAADYGVKVIVGEEVKTADQGEVIGLFLHEKIPRGMTLQETVAAIKAQGGLVYVPHPFDRMHSVPDYKHLLTVLEHIDAIEIYNPRVAIGSFNEEAERFAAKYRIVAGAGSDSHVPQGLGSVRVRLRDFDGPLEFLEALRAAEIHTKPASLLYVQALKFLETKATPSGARAARRARRVARATRKS
ncbi:MAG TPA: CehA/McbA family metallohydrolase [Solirubrobacteraceae bacterium]|nr:CehA/McbA family metallohydrolase [Solirubrobacteraceae bacterium]